MARSKAWSEPQWCPLMPDQPHLPRPAEAACPLCAKLSCLPEGQPQPASRTCFRMGWMLLYFPCCFLKCLDQLTDVALRKRGGKPSLMPPGMCVSFNNPSKGMQAAHGESFLEGEADQLQGHQVLWHFCFVRMRCQGHRGSDGLCSRELQPQFYRWGEAA